MNSLELFKELCVHGMFNDKKEEFRNLMVTGPPNSERKQIWLALSGAGCYMAENPGYYQKLLLSKMLIESPATLQVDKDLERTFASERFFVNKNNVKKLRNVLVTYSFRNETIGYCQGLNFIVARLLGLGYSEEESFWMLSQILEMFMPFDYYTDMTGLILDMKVLNVLISKYCPKVFEHLKNLGVEPLLFAVQWFVCLFSYNLPCETVIRVWDVFLCEGQSFLFSVALAILHIYRKKIVAIDNFNKALEYLVRMSNDLTDTELLIETTEKFRIMPGEIEANRKMLKDSLNFPENISISCIDEKTCKTLQGLTSDYFTFKSVGVNYADESYWDKEVTVRQARCSLRLSCDEDLVIGVKNHYCSKEIPKKRLSKVFQLHFKGNVKIAMPRISLSPYFLLNSYQEIIEIETEMSNKK